MSVLKRQLLIARIRWKVIKIGIPTCINVSAYAVTRYSQCNWTHCGALAAKVGTLCIKSIILLSDTLGWVSTTSFISLPMKNVQHTIECSPFEARNPLCTNAHSHRCFTQKRKRRNQICWLVIFTCVREPNYMFLYASVLVLTRFDSVYCSVTMVL